MWHIGGKNIAESSWNNTSTAMNHINENIQSSDVIISGEIYTYFHTSYYNRTNKEIILYWQLKQEFHDGDLIIGLYVNKL